MNNKNITFLFLVVLLSSFVLGEVIITEIMYNPPENDYDFEYLELFSNSTDVGGWYFEGISFTFPDNITIENHTTIANTLNDSGENNDFLDKYNRTCFFEYVNSLSNSGENISLFNKNGELIDTFYYNKSFGAYGDGDSLQFFNGSWCAALPTPGEGNYCPPPQSFTLSYPLDVLNDGTVFLVRANILNFPEGDNDIKVDIKDENGSRIGRIYHENEKKWKSTSYYLNNAFSVENEIKEHLLYLKIDPGKEYTGTAVIQGKLRNSLITPFYVFRVIDSKLEEDSSLEGEETKETDSSIEILDSDSEIKFGEILKVKLNVYRGDTRKYAVNAYVKIDGKKVSEKITMHFKDKFTDYTLTVPIQLEPNCDEKIKEGKADIIIEGLGIEVDERITISGIDDSLCKFFSKEETNNEPVKETSTKEVQNKESCETPTVLSGNSVVEIPSNQINEKKKAILDGITGVVVYESSSEKAKNLIPSVLIAVLCLICLCLLFRR